MGSQYGQAQQWQPTRISPSSPAQPLASAPQHLPPNPENSMIGLPSASEPSSSFPQGSRSSDGRSSAHDVGKLARPAGSGMVLRWRTSPSHHPSSANTLTPSKAIGGHTGSQAVTRADSQAHSHSDHNNPLRNASVTQSHDPVVQQPTVQTVSDIHPIDRFQSPQLHYQAAQSAYYQESQSDPLDAAELAPEPPASESNVLPQIPNIQSPPLLDPPSFPPQLSNEASPADRPSKDDGQPQSQALTPEPLPALPETQSQSDPRDTEERDSQDALEEILKEARKASTPDCVGQREQLRGQPLTSISLDISPKLGDGLRSIKKQSDNSQERKAEVDKKSLLREWTDYRGEPLGSGRMTDLRFGNVILDDGGRERTIPVVNLSDVDMNYVSELWNLPYRCGSGFEPLEGRQFASSTVQWKASGACHNPLYFEQVQLERYGHETGPVLQPLVSSAQFLLTIPMMPYKMAINPPNECQYALGYYRPGNCAPYMIQPFPWSVKAGLVQAGFWTGASALFP